MAKDQADYIYPSGAQILANRIAAYWLARGHVVKVWTEPLNDRARNNDKIIYAVKSNLINGLPGGNRVGDV